MKRIVLFLAMLAGFSSMSRAQDWQQVPGIPIYGASITPYFLNESVGFIYGSSSGYSSNAEIYSTTDGGADFYPVDRFNNEYNVTIVMMAFTSLTHGYILVDSQVTIGFNSALQGIIYETSDGGTTWQQVSPAWMSAHSIYAVDQTIFVTASSPEPVYNSPSFQYPQPGKIYFSQDDGVAWDSLNNPVSLPPLVSS